MISPSNMTNATKLFRFVIINKTEVESYDNHDPDDYARGDELLYFEIELPRKQSLQQVPKFIRIK